MTIRVEQEALDALPELLADPKIMPQVFTNLLDNAIKYSKKGTLITLSLQDRGPGFCLICIHNIGIPISEVERKRVFEREYRSEIARAFNPVGNGLGLPIAQAIIERHGGSVSVTSEPAHDHKGYANVRFYVKVPL
jgi:signal transduction histidine kinase